MTPSKQAAYLGIKYFGMAMCGYDEESSGSALRLAADIDKALDQVRAEERARSAKLAQALEFYAIRDRCFAPEISPAKQALATYRTEDGK